MFSSSFALYNTSVLKMSKASRKKKQRRYAGTQLKNGVTIL
jgi:hypothetical protein